MPSAQALPNLIMSFQGLWGTKCRAKASDFRFTCPLGPPRHQDPVINTDIRFCTTSFSGRMPLGHKTR